MGPATESNFANLVDYEDYVYADPKFSWQRTVAPAGLTFVTSGAMSNYYDSLFVGDCNNSNIYRFTLNEKRDGFMFMDPALSDKVANLDDSMSEITFGEKFGCVTDLDIGPDGLLYITSLGSNAIFSWFQRPWLLEIEVYSELSEGTSNSSILLQLLQVSGLRREEH
jgi:aldose sugar dehydrogenase